MSEDRSYEVGYGKPPKHSRFKPGQSGNPKGRKPGSKNVMTLLGQTLFDPVTRLWLPTYSELPDHALARDLLSRLLQPRVKPSATFRSS